MASLVLLCLRWIKRLKYGRMGAACKLSEVFFFQSNTPKRLFPMAGFFGGNSIELDSENGSLYAG